MGREARLRKDRVCKHCGKKLFRDVRALLKHVEYCSIATRMGLVIPEAVDRPAVKIIKP